MSFIDELKRRNVFKVVIAYVVSSWLVAQVAELAADSFGAPDWVMKMFITLLALGFPFVIIFSWAFEMTPEGIKKEKDIDRSQSVTATTGQRLNHTIIGLLVLALGYFVFDKFVTTPDGGQLVQATTPISAESEQDNSIAVLPFVNMSDDSANEYFSDGLSEELLNLLAKIPELKVAARTSSFHFKGKTGDVADIGKQLKVAHVLEGSVRKSGNQVRITAQLVKTADGYHLWSETYDRQLDNIFQIQDEIATEVVDALKITLLGAAPKTTETDTHTYQLYLEAQFYHRTGNSDSLAKAIDLYKRALAIDESYTPAWSGLAGAYLWYTGFGGLPIAEGNRLAELSIEKALSIDPTFADTYRVRSTSRTYNKYDFSGGLEDALHAVALDPGSAIAIETLGNANAVLGFFDKALEYYLKSVELDPMQPGAFASVGWIYYFTGDYDQAENAYRKTLALSPQFVGAHYRVGRVLLQKGDITNALLEFEKEIEKTVYSPTGLAMVHHTLGNSEASDQALNFIIANQAENAAYQIAEIYAFRGELEQAFEWLENAYKNRDSGLAFTLGNPPFHNLTSDPRWEQFLQKMGLLEAWRGLPPELGGPAL